MYSTYSVVPVRSIPRGVGPIYSSSNAIPARPGFERPILHVLVIRWPVVRELSIPILHHSSRPHWQCNKILSSFQSGSARDCRSGGKGTCAHLQHTDVRDTFQGQRGAYPLRVVQPRARPYRLTTTKKVETEEQEAEAKR